MPDFATIVALLRTHQNKAWQWDKKEQSAFKELKEKLSSEVMTFSTQQRIPSYSLMQAQLD